MKVEYVKGNEITIQRGIVKDTYYIGINFVGMWIVEPHFGRLNKYEEEIQLMVDKSVNKIKGIDFDTKYDICKAIAENM